MSKGLTLVLGGARSGKSDFALKLALRTGGAVLFVATAEPGDEEMRARIEAHRRQRPRSWRVLDAPRGVGRLLTAEYRGEATVLVDCVTMLVSNVLLASLPASGVFGVAEAETALSAVRREIEELLDTAEGHPARYILVSNEVGLGVVPDNALARLYRDALGRANRLLAARAHELYLLVAGIPLVIKGPGR
ncbi:MAG: bifunctional adenosylcobinamide kinase/adenosylcobinamide-phosphate guanylyltransferase [Firmicutes bacterium]|nr:bifunctional adenosylcobinamide kinase/adenosylcobinamide-phosphate guanylyltransferase [Bacillota bacterium]